MSWLLETDAALLRLRLGFRLTAEDWIHRENRAFFEVRKREFVRRHSLEAFAQLGHCESFSLCLVLPLKRGELSANFSEFCLEAEVVELTTQSLSDRVSDLRVSILDRSCGGLLSHLRPTFNARRFPDCLLFESKFVLENLLSEAFWKVAPLAIFVYHVREAFFHFCLYGQRLALYVFHLFFDRRDTFLQDCRI